MAMETVERILSLRRVKLSIFYFVTLLLPIIWIPLFFYKCFVFIIVRLFRRKEFSGKMFNSMDSLLEENFFQANVSKNSLVSSMTLEGDMSIEELRDLFCKNVLEAGLSETSIVPRLWGRRDKYNLRYPELRQYPAIFMGYWFWKVDPNFKIENHIVERVYSEIVGDPKSQPSLSQIHEIILNKTYELNKSPWELILIRNFKGGSEDKDKQEPGVNRCLIISRMHHSMADAKSITKLFVEGLGQKQLATAHAQAEKRRPLYFYLLFPVAWFVVIGTLLLKSLQYRAHPFKANPFRTNREQMPQRVKLSPRLPLKDIKAVAKKNGVTTSSAILSIISGAIRRNNPDLGNRNLLSVYILPRANHPDTLGNHLHLGVLILPTDVVDPATRIQQCHKIFTDLKASNLDKYLQFSLFKLGLLFNPVRKITLRDLTCPIGITNIAGESTGFKIGSKEVSEAIFSVGTTLGCAGVVFCASSYKENMRIAVMAEMDILDEETGEGLAYALHEELESLKAL